ncbi:MAG: ribosome assembly cofactor RimP [Treponema sp.]|nr:ribosome assembly cofactor RimP [Treponema sp.]MCL2271340.1 ribosome assembly cofactor RimP [Treponema sp.]
MRQENQDFSLHQSLEEVVKGLGFSLVELTVARHRGSAQIKAVIYKAGCSISTDDCTRVHRAVTPRLELVFTGSDINLEVSSPGIDRLIKDSSEFIHYKGRGIRCYRTDITEWTAGILETADEKGINIKTTDGIIRLDFDIIAKAKLDSSQEV